MKEIICYAVEGNGSPLQCSCLENPRDRGAWWAAIYGVAQSQTRLKRLSSTSRSLTLGSSLVQTLCGLSLSDSQARRNPGRSLVSLSLYLFVLRFLSTQGFYGFYLQ